MSLMTITSFLNSTWGRVDLWEELDSGTLNSKMDDFCWDHLVFFFWDEVSADSFHTWQYFKMIWALKSEQVWSHHRFGRYLSTLHSGAQWKAKHLGPSKTKSAEHTSHLEISGGTTYLVPQSSLFLLNPASYTTSTIGCGTLGPTVLDVRLTKRTESTEAQSGLRGGVDSAFVVNMYILKWKHNKHWIYLDNSKLYEGVDAPTT